MAMKIANIKQTVNDFFYYGLPGWVYRFNDWCRDLWYGQVTRCHWKIRTKLKKRSWIDSDSRILYGMMAVLDDFYRDEIALNIVDWEADEDIKRVKKELDGIKEWWDNYENRLKEIENRLNQWADYSRIPDENGELSLHFLNRKRDEVEMKLFDAISVAENKLKNEEQEMLKKLIELRFYMWT